MTKILLGSVALVALALGPAMAADMTPAPVYTKAPVMAPLYDWTAFYIGGHLGGRWSHTDSTTTDTFTGAVFAPTSGNQSSFFGGGQVGFDYMSPSRFVFGVVADVSSGSSDSTTTSNPAGTLIETNASKTDVTGTVRGRLGYAMNNVLLYATGGWAWNSGSRTRTQVLGTVHLATAGTSETLSVSNSGWVVGGGLDYAFAPNWDLFGEYRYTALEAITVAYPLSGRSTNSTSNVNTFEAGLNYRFNWGMH